METSNTSKNTITRYINKIKVEFSIIEKILNNLRELSIFENIEESKIQIDNIEKELEEIALQVDYIIEAAELHLKERLEKGKLESISRSQGGTKSVVGSESSNSEAEQSHQSELSEASKRAEVLHLEEMSKEEEVNRKVAELELARRRTEEA